MIGCSESDLSNFRKHKNQIHMKKLDLEDQINEIVHQIEVIQMRMNLYLKTAEKRQRLLKKRLDEKKEFLNDLRRIAS